MRGRMRVKLEMVTCCFVAHYCEDVLKFYTAILYHTVPLLRARIEPISCFTICFLSVCEVVVWSVAWSAAIYLAEVFRKDNCVLRTPYGISFFSSVVLLLIICFSYLSLLMQASCQIWSQLGLQAPSHTHRPHYPMSCGRCLRGRGTLQPPPVLHPAWPIPSPPPPGGETA